MTAAALAFRFDRPALQRGMLAGIAWGLAMSAGFGAIAISQCEVPCPDDVAFGTLICVGTGLVTMGPLAAFFGRRRAA